MNNEKRRMPLVSVIMSVYNEKTEFLEEALSSILNQTYKNIEVIIIDDGCDDICKELIQRYSTRDSRIIIVHNETNLGLTKSLNIGIDIASGDYIARMDSDDCSVSIRFEKQVCYMENNPSVAVLGTEACDFEGNRLNLIHYSNDFETTKVRMLFMNAGIYHPSAMIRADFIRKNNIRYNESYSVSQDYRLWLDVIMSGGVIQTLPEMLLRYRMHSGQITSKKIDLQRQNTRKAQKEYLEFLLNSCGVADTYHLSGAGVSERDEINEVIRREMESLSLLTAPKTVKDSLMGIKYFLKKTQIDKRKAKQEILMRYIKRGVHLIKHEHWVKAHYFVNIFFISCLAPWNILYAVSYFSKRR